MTSTSIRKIILAIFLLIIAVEVIMGVRMLLKPVSRVEAGPKLAPVSGGKISLVPDSRFHSIGEAVVVAVRVSSGGHPTDGTDLYLKYDPNLLSASPSGFTKGNIYGEYPVVSVDDAQGVIRVSGIALTSQVPFNGVGELGRISFKALKSGQTDVSAVYQNGSTTYSNIIETGTAKNLLNSSSSVTLSLSATPALSAPPSACSPRVFQTCKDTSGKVGSYWCASADDPLTCRVGCFTTLSGSDVGCSVVTTSSK